MHVLLLFNDLFTHGAAVSANREAFAIAMWRCVVAPPITFGPNVRVGQMGWNCVAAQGNRPRRGEAAAAVHMVAGALSLLVGGVLQKIRMR